MRSCGFCSWGDTLHAGRGAVRPARPGKPPSPWKAGVLAPGTTHAAPAPSFQPTVGGAGRRKRVLPLVTADSRDTRAHCAALLGGSPPVPRGGGTAAPAPPIPSKQTQTRPRSPLPLRALGLRRVASALVTHTLERATGAQVSGTSAQATEASCVDND